MVMLTKILESSIKTGRLTLIEPNGRTTGFGQADFCRPESDVVVRLKGPLTPIKLALRPDLYLGEAYVDGTLVIERGGLWELLDFCGRNLSHSALRHTPAGRLIDGIARLLQQYNPMRRAKKNAAHHYDLSPVLYRAFLDQDLQYSCAYFLDERVSLDEAQCAKKNHIASKLLLRPGCRVLDIGCGWGGLALSLAEAEDVEVTGVTLSQEQLQVARQRAKERGLEKRVKFELVDYRVIEGTFDRIVSVGMFEHVGTPHYGAFFEKLASLLARHGIALIHSIGRVHGPDLTSAWIRKYIFPGGYIPALSQVLPAVETSGLWLTDLEILRGHYAETLRSWRHNLFDRLAEVRKTYDERFCRKWEFYLAVSEMAFRYGGMMVFQAQLARSADAVPVTRDYMFEYERGSANSNIGVRSPGSEAGTGCLAYVGQRA
jgi:cyclopropane-fatty-acyl-phospholipid synthase